MPTLVIRDSGRVRTQWLVTGLSLLLLAGYAVLRRFVGPQDGVPMTMYLVIGALVLAWGIFSVVTRSVLMRIGPHGVSGPRVHLTWDQIRSAEAHAGELVVTADARHTFSFPPDRTDAVNAAIAQHRSAGQR